jgi:hypothetical protein
MNFTHLIDQKYIHERNALIPEAEKFANKQFGARGPGGTNRASAEYAANWSRCFINKMVRLWATQNNGGSKKGGPASL